MHAEQPRQKQRVFQVDRFDFVSSQKEPQKNCPNVFGNNRRLLGDSRTLHTTVNKV